MPRQNRMQPDGRLIADPARGQFTGNRGILHGADGLLGVARWRHKAWITCTIRPRPGRPPLPKASPGHYTPLFFHDEAVACAAGHRPCAECRRAVWNDFRAAWGRAFGTVPRATEVNATLHAARIVPGTRDQRRHLRPARDLPDGVFIRLEGQPHLIRAGQAWPYAPGGYGAPRSLPAGDVPVLTPAPLVAVMAAGWQPVLNAADDRPGW